MTIAVLLGSAGVCKSADFQKGLTAAQNGDFATDLRRTLAPRRVRGQGEWAEWIIRIGIVELGELENGNSTGEGRAGNTNG